jgi:hypothetical protein
MPSIESGHGSRVGGGDESKNLSRYRTNVTNNLKNIILVMAEEGDGIVNGDKSEAFLSLNESRALNELGEGKEVATQSGDEKRVLEM